MDIGNDTIEENCPQCNSVIRFTLYQVANEELIKCSCGHEIQLRDENGTNKKTIDDINKSFNKLDNAFKNFGR